MKKPTSQNTLCRHRSWSSTISKNCCERKVYFAPLAIIKMVSTGMNTTGSSAQNSPQKNLRQSC